MALLSRAPVGRHARCWKTEWRSVSAKQRETEMQSSKTVRHIDCIHSHLDWSQVTSRYGGDGNE